MAQCVVVTTLLLSNTLLQNSGSPSVIVGKCNSIQHVSPCVYFLCFLSLVSLKFLKMLNPLTLVQHTFSSIIKPSLNIKEVQRCDGCYPTQRMRSEG